MFTVSVHCWDYRFFIVRKANVSDTDELEFTSKKILNNFSNYSSWHYRSKLLKKLYPSNVHDLPIRADKHNEGDIKLSCILLLYLLIIFLKLYSQIFLFLELDLVMNATFTDPNDSSAWFYHRWLLDYWKAPVKLWRAVLNKLTITVAFHKKVPLDLELYLNAEKMECNWKSPHEKNLSVVWYAVFDKPLCDNYKEISLKYENDFYKLILLNTSSEWIYKGEILSGNQNSFKLSEQLDNYQMLSKMEPSNKWAKSTSMHLMLNIDPISKHPNIMEGLNDLIKVDSLRANYYKDMREYIIK